MIKNIQKFIEKLSEQKVNKLKVFNQYHADDNFPQYFTTKLNLLFYLTQMKQRNPKTLLIGEASGKDGCAITGIPFTSLEILSQENKFGLFGFPEKPNRKLQKERTATMVWDTLLKLNFCPLLWNAFPFNPIDPNTKKNRKPTKEEIKIGEIFLKGLIKIFKTPNIVAIGNTADDMLKQMNIDHYTVPHPSFGNKGNFYNGLKYLIDEGKIN